MSLASYVFKADRTDGKRTGILARASPSSGSRPAVLWPFSGAFSGRPKPGDTLAQVVEVSVRAQVGERAVVPLLCIAAGIAIGVATWLLLVGQIEPAGFAALAAGAVSSPAVSSCARTTVWGEWRSRSVTACSTGVPPGRALWSSRTEDAWLAAGALCALAAGFLASYIAPAGDRSGTGSRRA